MNTGLLAVVAVVAAVATGAAVAAGGNVAIAVPAATIAVVAVAFLLVGVVERTRWPPPRPFPPLGADPGRVRSALGAGTYGRESLIALLDQLDRGEAGAHLSSTPPEEVARLCRLGPEEFRDYLGHRVSALERRA